MSTLPGITLAGITLAALCACENSVILQEDGGGGAPVCGDGTCAGGESCLDCTQDCGECGACVHTECEEGPALDKGCSPCAQAVCEEDGFCCGEDNGFWDLACVSYAVNSDQCACVATDG